MKSQLRIGVIYQNASLRSEGLEMFPTPRLRSKDDISKDTKVC